MGMHDVLTVCDGLLHGEPGQVPGVCQGGRSGGTTSSPSRRTAALAGTHCSEIWDGGGRLYGAWEGIHTYVAQNMSVYTHVYMAGEPVNSA